MEAYLHEHIPLSRAMGARVRTATPDEVVLEAPLAPNLNHRSTAFGGSVAAHGILSGWTLMHMRLAADQVLARTVIQKSDVRYLEPIHGDFVARTAPVDPEDWRRFLAALGRFGRARLRVSVDILCDDLLVAQVAGDYVSLAGEDEED